MNFATHLHLWVYKTVSIFIPVWGTRLQTPLERILPQSLQKRLGPRHWRFSKRISKDKFGALLTNWLAYCYALSWITEVFIYASQPFPSFTVWIFSEKEMVMSRKNKRAVRQKKRASPYAYRTEEQREYTHKDRGRNLQLIRDVAADQWEDLERLLREIECK